MQMMEGSQLFIDPEQNNLLLTHKEVETNGSKGKLVQS